MALGVGWNEVGGLGRLTPAKREQNRHAMQSHTVFPVVLACCVLCSKIGLRLAARLIRFSAIRIFSRNSPSQSLKCPLGATGMSM